MAEAKMLHPSAALTAIDDFFDEIFAAVDTWLPMVEEQLQQGVDAGGLTGAQLTAMVESGAHGTLDTPRLPLYGAGFCASETLITEGNPLAWWQGADRKLLASSTFGPGQAAIDLHRLEWYRVPAETGQRHVAGPFVDYLCSNEITLTAAAPVHLGGEFVGVLCVDVLVSALELELLPHVKSLGAATLLNVNGRVVLSAEDSLQTGDRMPGWDANPNQLELQTGGTVYRSGKHPFALVVN